MNVNQTANMHFMHKEYEKAARLYKEGALSGDMSAAFNYGYCLWRGLGVDYDPVEAKSYFVYAREMPGGESCYNLAMLYMHGEGVKRDYKQVIRYMRISAQHGCIEAKLYLGMAFTTGAVFEPDIQGICMIPFHKPEYRVPDVFLLTGDVFDAEADEDARMSVISADANSAFEYFRSAAHSDPTYVSDLVAKGQYLYAKCYIDGLGTDFNREKGTMLMLAAGKSGSNEAVAFLAENGITPELILGEGKSKKYNRSGGV